MPETGINLSGVGITGAALLILAAAVILMSEVITMTMIVTSAREKLNAGRLIIIAAITSFINFAVFLFLQFHESLSLGLSGMILRLLRLEFTYQNAYSFVMISGLCLIGGFLLGLLFEAALFGRINGIRLGQGWALMLAVIIWSTAYFAAERMEVYSEESINIISADRNVRHIENDVPVLSDQVVIANSGKLLCSMEDFYLTDNKDRMSRMSLGNTYASAGERITLSVDDSFSLREGDPVYLYDSRGNLVSSYPDEENATPGMPVLSSASGFYAEPFELTITAGENETIYYSLDGSDPVEHGVPYTEPIHVYDRSEEETVFRSYPRTHYDWQFETEQDTSPVDRCFVVKAAAVDKAGRISDTVTGSYFINKDQYAGKVISLTADPEDLFGEYGICVTGKAYDEWALSGEISNAPKPNFEKRGREWEIPGTIELFDGNAYVMTDRAGLRVAGGSSRSDPIKRFSAYARRELGASDYFSIDFFEDNSDVHAIVLRPSSVNAVFPLLTSDRDVLGMRSFPVTVFLNGEYWYDTYLGEKYTAEYFNTYFDISPGNVLAIKSELLEEGDDKDYHLYTDIFDFIENHDLSDPEAYSEFCDMVDIQSYIDYSCINLYAVNLDADDRTNVYLWRTIEPEEGHENADAKWHWALYDMDALGWISPSDFGVETKADINTFVVQPPHEDILPCNQQELYLALKSSPEFCRQFVTSFMDIINTDFRPEKAAALLEAMGDDISWGDHFFENRPDKMISFIAEEFGLDGAVGELRLHVDNPEGGKITVNTANPDISSGEWTGKYFKEYPVTVKAEPIPGWRFAGFEEAAPGESGTATGESVTGSEDPATVTEGPATAAGESVTELVIDGDGTDLIVHFEREE